MYELAAINNHLAGFIPTKQNHYLQQVTIISTKINYVIKPQMVKIPYNVVNFTTVPNMVNSNK
ncbi:hypothetical protein CXF78_15160 [Shewanella sp. 11B5]|nr:hypothetical protein CXF78_15160 [Shewanella sp. 11B5]HBF47423.1 hypothetical protein [Shewanella frigidimarina]